MSPDTANEDKFESLTKTKAKKSLMLIFDKEHKAKVLKDLKKLVIRLKMLKIRFFVEKIDFIFFLFKEIIRIRQPPIYQMEIMSN